MVRIVSSHKYNDFGSDDFSVLEGMDDSDSDSDNGVLEETDSNPHRLPDGDDFDEENELHLFSLSEVEVKAEAEAVMMVKSLLEEFIYSKGLVGQLLFMTDSSMSIYWLLDRMREIKSMISPIFKMKELDLTQRLAAVDLKSLKEKMNTFTTSAEKLCKRKGIAVELREHSFSKSDQGDSSSSRQSITFEGIKEKEVVGFKEEVVGFKKEVDKLLGMLHSEGKGELEIVSIVGAAGGGKTTLAREVFEHPQTSYTFAIRAWVNVSQQYDKTMKRKLLIPILVSACSGAHEDYEKNSDDKLGEDTLKCLKGKRYLIVMDDVWSTEAWDDIQRSLPKECYGSKLLLTSRLPVQPNYLHCIDPLHLASLSKDCSWELLRKKVFGQNNCPLELVGIGEHIVEKCQGLPLAIIAIAGILVMKEKKLEVWKEVSNHLSSTIASNVDGCMAILELSYNHLPFHLKECFVYIGGFPEDYEILAHELIWLWIGEGFIQQSEGDESLEDVAKDYLINLIKRNLVMVASNRFSGGIKAFRIHDLLRELCIEKAKENNFLMQMYQDDTFPHSANLNHHRLFIGSQFFHELSLRPCTQNLSSFLCLNLQNSNMSSVELDLSFFVENFELLRVLYFTSAICQGEIGEGYLVHLRYLAIQVPYRISHFQLPFSYLFNLETLYLQGRIVANQMPCIRLPCNIFKMVKLRHLYAKRGVFQYHHDDQDSPNKASGSGFESSSRLDSLRTLHQICPCEKCRNFLARTPNLRKLRISKARASDDSGDVFYFIVNPDLEFLKCLETLRIDDCIIYNALKLPPTLTQLTLKLSCLSWEKLSSLQTLPRLEVLKLLMSACTGKIWNMSELEGFPQLKYLRLEGLPMKRWKATEDQLPKLEVLVVNDCVKLKRIPIDFANLNELRKIEVRRCGYSVEESARQIQEDRINERGDDGRIELLAEDNSF